MEHFFYQEFENWRILTPKFLDSLDKQAQVRGGESANAHFTHSIHKPCDVLLLVLDYLPCGTDELNLTGLPVRAVHVGERTEHLLRDFSFLQRVPIWRPDPV